MLRTLGTDARLSPGEDPLFPRIGRKGEGLEGLRTAPPRLVLGEFPPRLARHPEETAGAAAIQARPRPMPMMFSLPRRQGIQLPRGAGGAVGSL